VTHWMVSAGHPAVYDGKHYPTPRGVPWAPPPNTNTHPPAAPAGRGVRLRTNPNLKP